MHHPLEGVTVAVEELPGLVRRDGPRQPRARQQEPVLSPHPLRGLLEIRDAAVDALYLVGGEHQRTRHSAYRVEALDDPRHFGRAERRIVRRQFDDGGDCAPLVRELRPEVRHALSSDILQPRPDALRNGIEVIQPLYHVLLMTRAW